MKEVVDSALEAALKRDRIMVLVGLVLAVALSWIYLVLASRDMYGAMDGLSAWMMTAAWDLEYGVLIFAMWVVMMVGMMLVGMVMPFTTSGWEIVNAGLLAIVLAEITQNGLAAWSYRRSAA